MNLYIKSERTFTLLENKVKTVEVRVLKGFINQLKPNMNINLVHKNKKVESIIKNIIIYNSFSSLLKTEGICKVLPDIKSINVGIEYLHEFYSNTHNYPIIAISF